MQNLIPIFLIVLIAYFIFSRKGGGMGCCGGHMEPDARRHDNGDRNLENSIHNNHEQVIDLREDEYTVIATEDKKLPKI